MSYASEVLADAPAGYWRLGEASGLPQDSSGHAQHASVVTGVPIYSQLGAVGDPDTAIKLTGTQAFTVPDSATVDLADVFTLEAWVRRNTLNGTQNTIISKGTSAYAMRISSDDHFHLLAAGTALIAGSTFGITDTSNYHYLVTTKSGAAVKIYVDGVECTGAVTNTTCVDNALPLLIGADTALTSFGDITVDEVAVYPTVLPQVRVTAHYNAARVALMRRRRFRRGRRL